MKNLVTKSVGLALALLASANSNATNGISCSGTVAIIGVHSPNAVILKLSSTNVQVQICDLGATVGVANPIPAEQCKAIYSTLLAAHAMNKTINVVFDNVQTGTNCSNFHGWELATARWVAFIN